VVLDPRQVFPGEFSNTEFPVATGNQVSVEFNLAYRWHSTVSAKDEAWSLDFFQKLFPGRDVSVLSLRDFFTGLSAWKNEVVAQKPESRTFADLKRDDSGHFDSWDLARLMAEATQDISGKCLLVCSPMTKSLPPPGPLTQSSL